MENKLTNILNRIIKEKGEVLMFAVLKMDEFLDKWTIILSADWVTEENRENDFNYLRELLIESLTSEERSTIARIGVLAKSNHLVQLLLQLKTGTKISEDTRLNGNIIHEGNILVSSNNKEQIDNS